MVENTIDDPLSIPSFLRRDTHNESEITRMVDSTVENEVESRPAKSMPKASAKANGAAKAPIKAAGKVKAKAPAKVAKIKAAPVKAPKAAKVAKPKAELDGYGFRKGSSKSAAAAMYARKSGATLEEVKEKVGSVQLNCLNDLEGEGYVVERKKETREGARPVTRYRLLPKA